MSIPFLIFAPMRYKVLKYLGNTGWAFTYVCFIVIAATKHWGMIPLIVCSYNIAYEFLYTILATDKGQRYRNGIWFLLDSFIIYYNVVNSGVWQWFLFCFSAMLIIQLVLSFKISKGLTKSFSWFVNLLMALILFNHLPQFNSNWVVAALIGKFIGDFFYAAAHLCYGVPAIESSSIYGRLLNRVILATVICDLLVIIKYLHF